jgi:hypothetical protein
VVFGGFAPNELATRIDDAAPKVIVSASCGIEVSRVIEYKPMLDRAIEIAANKPERCIILQRPQAPATLGDRDLDTFRASVLCDLTAGTVVVHDRYQLYDNTEFRHVAHQLCCAHLLRDLQGAAEVYPDELWPTQIADALRGLIHATNTARDNGHPAIEAATRDRLLHTLRHGVLTGLSATTTRGNRPGEHKARLLLETFRDRHHDILRFVTDLTVPPTSNDAERGLRPSKVQQNVSGRLTSVARTQDRYRILGYAATAAKHGHDKMTVIRDAVVARPWMPELPVPHLTVRM